MSAALKLEGINKAVLIRRDTDYLPRTPFTA